jgi:D-amino peptidase
MRVAVFADIEGSFGIWRMRQCKTGTGEWQYGRERLTEDVNRVIKGAFDAGAKSVVVKDTHDTGFNCIRKSLDSRAEYIGGHYIEPTFFGDVLNCDLVLYVGIHDASGTEGAFFPHTHFGIFSEVRINGRVVSEMDVYGGYLGEFGIPVGFVSGEDIAVKQATESLPWAESVAVDKKKEAYTYGEKSVKYLKKGRRQLEEKAAVVVKNISRMKPLILEGPLHFEVTFRSEKLLSKYNSWNFTRKDLTVEWESKNMIEGFDNFNKLTFFPKKVYPFRRQLLFFMRSYYRIKNGYFYPKPNSEGAVRLSDIKY